MVLCQLTTSRGLFISLSALMLALASCGSDSKSEDPVNRDITPVSDAHIVDDSAKTYAEKSEATNTCTVPEVTEYKLDATGIIITGAFEASNPTIDCFNFNSGTSSWAAVKVFVNGTVSKISAHTKCSGYSESVAAAGQEKVAVVPNLACNVILYPKATEASGTYVIEMKAMP